jgi:hypothetical protein
VAGPIYVAGVLGHTSPAIKLSIHAHAFATAETTRLLASGWSLPLGTCSLEIL